MFRRPAPNVAVNTTGRAGEAPPASHKNRAQHQQQYPEQLQHGQPPVQHGGRGGKHGGRPVCRFFAQGNCRKGAACEFSHDFEGAAPVQERVQPQLDALPARQYERPAAPHHVQPVAVSIFNRSAVARPAAPILHTSPITIPLAPGVNSGGWEPPVVTSASGAWTASHGVQPVGLFSRRAAPALIVPHRTTPHVGQPATLGGGRSSNILAAAAAAARTSADQQVPVGEDDATMDDEHSRSRTSVAVATVQLADVGTGTAALFDHTAAAFASDTGMMPASRVVTEPANVHPSFKLSPADLAAYRAVLDGSLPTFTLGSIPEVEPPPNLCR